jgi:hypothetical protein
LPPTAPGANPRGGERAAPPVLRSSPTAAVLAASTPSGGCAPRSLRVRLPLLSFPKEKETPGWGEDGVIPHSCGGNRGEARQVPAAAWGNRSACRIGNRGKADRVVLEKPRKSPWKRFSGWGCPFPLPRPSESLPGPFPAREWPVPDQGIADLVLAGPGFLVDPSGWSGAMV